MKQLIRHILREHTSEIQEIKKKTTDEFVTQAKKIHGDRYDYSKTNYTSAHDKVEIICPIHGSFFQSATSHLKGGGCAKCTGNKSDSNEFIEKAKKIFGNKYDYSKVDYKTNKDKVEIICPIHGSFFQTPKHHLTGRSCSKCAVERRSDTLDDFIEKSREVHGDKYDYSKVDYDTNRNPVKIICPLHGEFIQRPHAHMGGAGCPKCAGRLVNNTDEFIEKAKEIHGNKYDYSLVNYIEQRVPVDILCSKHGLFKQLPSNHLKGGGCPICSESKGEKFVREIFIRKKIEFIPQYKFDDCTNKKQGRSCRKLTFDFYLPNQNTCLEYDGQQHFAPISGWGGNSEENFIKRLKLDKIRDQYCKKNGIKLIRIPYTMKKEDIEPYILKELGIK